MKTLKKISVVVLMMICILTFTIKTNAAEEFKLNSCVTTTCHGEYINGFCSECDSYEPAKLIDNIYLISNAGQLYWFFNEIYLGNTSINGKLTKNIIINEGNVIGCNGVKDSKWRSWNLDKKHEYQGTFDGNGFYVSGVFQTSSNLNDRIGFFGSTANAKIKNLGIINSYFSGFRFAFLGGMVGFTKYSTFENCYIQATIVGKQEMDGYAGGFAGLSGDSNYYNCYANVTVEASDSDDNLSVGGFIGSSYYNDGYLKNVAASATIKVAARTVKVGSLIGNNRDYVHKNTYYDIDKYATGIGASSNDATTKGVKTTAFTNGTVCQNLGGHFYKFVSNSTQHYQECTVCGNKTTAESHNIGEKATCKELAVCGTCGESHGEYDYTVHVSDEFDNNGFSLCCGYGYEPMTLVTEDNYTELGLTSDYIGYYAIGNAGQLMYFSNGVKNENSTFGGMSVVLVDDIDFNPGYTFNSDGTVLYENSPVTSGWREWVPIGTFHSSYNGEFNGNYHTISGLYTNDENMDYIGLFGAISYCEIYNVGVKNSYFNGDQYVGGIVGHASFKSSFENCYSEATVGARYAAAGIVAAGSCQVGEYSVKIVGCYYNGVLKPRGYTYMSGIYGGQNEIIKNSYYNSDKCNYGKKEYAMSEADFKSGLVAYLLNGDQSAIVYGQTIGTEDYPVFGGETVYGGYADCDSENLSVTNDANMVLNETKGHIWEYSSSGTTMTATCTQPSCSIDDRTETITIEALDSSLLTYNGEAKPIKVIESVVGLIPYQVEYLDADNNILLEAPKMLGTYTGRISIDDQTISVTYEITKAILEGKPEALVEFGRNYEEAEIVGTVYIKDTMIDVDGTWSWVPGEQKAIFTPTDQTMHNVLGETEVEIKVIAGDPILTVSSPVDDIAPGQSVYITFTVENKYDSSITDLPTQYIYTYRVDNGVEVEFTDGLLMVPMNTPIGSKVYVTVTLVAVEDKYNAISETIEILVAGNSGSVIIGENGNWFIDGQDSGKSAIGTIIEIGDNGNWFIDGVDTGKKVDYTTDIDALNQLLTQEVTRLEELISANDTDIENINKSINNINETIKALDEAYKLADTNLTKAIEDAKQAAMDAANKALEIESARLQALIEANDTDIENINKSINNINETIKALDEAYKLADASLQELINKTKADLETSLENTAKSLQENLDAAVKDLEAVDKENSEALSKAVKELTDLIETTEALLKANDEALKSDLEGQLAAAKDALTEAINKVQENLDAAVKDLDEKITVGDAANSLEIAVAVEQLNNAIKVAQAVANSNDKALKAELEAKLTKAEEELNKAINKVQENLDAAVKKLEEQLATSNETNALELSKATDESKTLIEAVKALSKTDDEALKEELMDTITTLQNEWLSKFSDLLAKFESAKQEAEKNDAALKEELLENTDKAIILPTVIACFAVVGNVGLLVWIIIDRKKRA